MSTTGQNYFFQKIGVVSQLQIFYDFKESGINPVPSVPLGSGIYSGIINNLNSFYKVTGSGYFDGSTTVSIQNASKLNSNNWSLQLNYELNTGQNGVLFSSYSSGNPASGFILGVNDNCQPYVEYFSNNGPVVLQSTNNWGTKNSLLLTRTPSHLTLDYFNFNSKNIESEQFFINDSYFLFSDRWTLGGFSGQPSYFSGQNFNGYIDNLLFFSPSLLPNQKNSIFSGIFSDIFPAAKSITSGVTSIITGYGTGLLPIFSGTTGQTNEFYNYLSGTCGNITAQYEIINLSGIIYDIFTVPLTQTIINYFTGVTGGFPMENSGYSKSFGMDAISYLKEVDNTDITEIFYFPNSTNKTNINNNLVFDRVLNKYLLSPPTTTDNINFYLNSAAQFGSGYSLSGTYYNPYVFLSGMFAISGLYLSGSNYDGLDTNIVDFISGSRIYSTGVSGLQVNNNSLFLDGVKLKSGIDYVLQGSQIVQTNSILSQITGGQYWTFPNDTESSYVSGNKNNFSLTRFARDTSLIYQNGLRANLNNDYVELSKYSPLNNISNYLSQLQTIYFNSNDFIENFTGFH